MSLKKQKSLPHSAGHLTRRFNHGSVLLCKCGNTIRVFVKRSSSAEITYAVASSAFLFELEIKKWNTEV